jgi:hypothetical protein
MTENEVMKECCFCWRRGLSPSKPANKQEAKARQLAFDYSAEVLNAAMVSNCNGETTIFYYCSNCRGALRTVLDTGDQRLVNLAMDGLMVQEERKRT